MRFFADMMTIRHTLLMFLLAGALCAAAPLLHENGFTFYVQEGQAIIAGFPSSADIALPATLGGCPVRGCDTTYLRHNGIAVKSFSLSPACKAFALEHGILFSYDKKTLVKYPGASQERTCEVPDGVTHIAPGAFTGARHLVSVKLPETLVSIGSEAFAYTSLAGLAFPKSVTEIGENAFAGTPLIAPSLPPNLLRLAEGVFSNCTHLTTISGGQKIVSIGDGAFANCTALTTVRLPESIQIIGKNAFRNCTALQSFNVTKNITQIGDNAFRGCLSLTAFTADKTNSVYMEINQGVLFDRLQKTLVAFPPNHADTSYEIPGAITSIAPGAFASCKRLTTVTLSPNMKVIGEGAFFDGPALSSWTLPASLEYIGDFAFAQNTHVTAFTLPKSIITLGKGTFSTCESLKELDISALPADTIPPSLCSGCTALSTVRLPATAKIIGAKAFYACSSLAEVALPETLQEIHEASFAQCAAIQRIQLPQSLRFIGDRAFATCKGLTELLLPGELSKLGRQAFENCESLVTVTFPRDLPLLRFGTFRNCISLQTAVFPGKRPTEESQAFDNCPKFKR